MAYFLGKGAQVPITSQAQQPGVPTERRSCLDTCEGKYQQMLADNNINDASAYQLYQECIANCNEPETAVPPQATPTAEPDTLTPSPATPAAAGQSSTMGGDIVSHLANLGGLPPGDVPDVPDVPGEPDVPLEPGLEQCIMDCYATHGMYNDTPARQACISGCHAKHGEKPGEGEICVGAVDPKIGKTEDGTKTGLVCPDGYYKKRYKTAGKATVKCCPGDDPGEDEPGVNDPTDDCAGGIPITQDFNMGKGGNMRTYEDPHGILPPTYKRSDAWEAHIVWDETTKRFYNVKDLYAHYEAGGTAKDMKGGEHKTCPKGHRRSGNMCCPDSRLEDQPGGLGEFQWPPELQGLYQLLMGRAGEFMNMEPGYSDEAIAGMFGKNFEKLRTAGDRTRESRFESAQREGLMGTDVTGDIAREGAWNTEKNIGDTIRDLLIADEEKKKQDLMDYTGMAQGLFGQGQGYNALLEQLNAGRRGEGQMSLAMLLQYLQSLMQSYGA